MAWLSRTIQDRGPGGHDPEEDARACVDLLKAKIKNGAHPLPQSERVG
jgi:RNA exonuclease 1